MRGRSLMIAGLLTAAFAGHAAAQTTVVGSPHDLSANTGPDNDEICVYCHTPHGGDNTQGPLWNKLATGETYNTYDATTTLDGELLTTLDKVSLACLTCHDGTQAPDVVINAPNSGFGDLANAGTGTALGDGITTITGAANIGNTGGDLTDDHPIAIQYGGFTPSGETAPIDPEFNTADLQTGSSAVGPIWWVEMGTSPSTRNKEDLVLYTRDNLAGTEQQPFVECGTCHDPHAGDTTLTTEVNFLRVSNASSSLCLACHIK